MGDPWPRPGLVLVSCSAPTCVTCGFHGPASAVESGGRLERAGAAALPPWQATPLTALLPSSFNSATPPPNLVDKLADDNRPPAPPPLPPRGAARSTR